VKFLGYCCFSGRSSIWSLSISVSTSSFGAYDYKKCSSLVSLISTSVKSLPNGCFELCSSIPHLQSQFQFYLLVVIAFKDTHPYPRLQSLFNDITWKFLFWWMLLFIINCNSSLSTISRRYSFSNGLSLTSLMISVSFTRIREKCFQNCFSLHNFSCSIKKPANSAYSKRKMKSFFILKTFDSFLGDLLTHSSDLVHFWPIKCASSYSLKIILSFWNVGPTKGWSVEK
jgi:hypothetical protein